MAVGVAVGAGVSDRTTDAAISCGACSGVSSDAKLAVSSCVIDSSEATACSGSTAGVSDTGLDTTTSWGNTDKLFVLGVDASFAEAERAAEACESASLTVGVSSCRVVFIRSRDDCKKMHEHF